jgi:hypothetical protein
VRVALTITARLRDLDLDFVLDLVFVGVVLGIRVLLDEVVRVIDTLGFREILDV